MTASPTLINPHLLAAGPRYRPISVFLCGPGFSHKFFEVRKAVKDYLEAIPNVQVTLGEDLAEKVTLPSRAPSDLQTLESYYAHTVDFTILLLESPGAIAELGTFSMIPNVQPRLFVVVSSEFYGSESYIARGPLSLLAAHNQNNVIYYKPPLFAELFHRLDYPISLYKFCSFFGGIKYQYRTKTIYRTPRKELPSYWDFVRPLHDKFLQTVILASINMLSEPTFSDLVRYLHLSPGDLTNGLRELFKKKCIRKGSSGKYYAVRGFQEPRLRGFSSTRISRRRAEILAG